MFVTFRDSVWPVTEQSDNTCFVKGGILPYVDKEHCPCHNSSPISQTQRRALVLLRNHWLVSSWKDRSFNSIHLISIFTTQRLIAYTRERACEVDATVVYEIIFSLVADTSTIPQLHSITKQCTHPLTPSTHQILNEPASTFFEDHFWGTMV
jgi:hypothetical protein